MLVYKRLNSLQLSIIIVNYNVKYFLEQCLCSVEKAIKNIATEVWVVDNASTDDSERYLLSRFPWISFVANKTNVGFAKANNQALQKCEGKYVLFLNPDTILPEDCLEKCLAFIERTEKAGAVGIRMIDGSGKFLAESKRSFPSPLISFFKLVGLSSLFPKSKLFAKYSLGYLDPLKNHEVDVLAGAFLMCNRELLLKLKGFDETFFMYGEDIDLSYRIQQQGFANYYFSESSIIHFKGESTRKGSLNYVRMFYQAMNIFVQKHYGGSRAALFRFFIKMAIWLRATFSAVGKVIVKIGLPMLDALIIFGAFQLVNHLWIEYARDGQPFIVQLVNIALPGFTLVFLLAAALAGMYDRKYKPSGAFYAATAAIIVMLAAYALLPEKYRFSRGVILFGGVAAAIFTTFFRWLLLTLRIVEDSDESRKHEQTVIVATPEEYGEVREILEKAGLAERILGRVAANGRKEDALATVEQLQVLLKSIGPREIIFCQGMLSNSEIIERVQQLPANVYVRFHAHGSSSIVGSDSKNTAGEFVTEEGHFRLSLPYQKRMKRLVDITFACFIILTFPVQILIGGIHTITNAFEVLIAKKTWVGYTATAPPALPCLRAGILSTSGLPASSNPSFNPDGAYQIDHWYARHYDWLTDVKLILKHYKGLGS